MNFILRTWQSLFGGNATRLDNGDQSPDPGLYNGQAAAKVTEDTALQLSAFWGCARLISEVYASLPLTMREIKGGSAVTSHPVLTLLTRSPNSRQTPVEFTETMQLNLCMHGNAYARIEYNKQKIPIALWPLPAQQVQTTMLDDGSVIHYWYHGHDVTALSDKSVLHIRLFGNGLIGLSPLAYGRNSLGLSSAIETQASQYFVNGAKPSGVLYTDAMLTPDQRKKTREQFTEIVTEKEESKRLLVLPMGFKYQQVQMNPADIQMLESRRYQLKDICRFMGNIPPVLICETQDSTALGSSIEQILIGWYRLGLNPYGTRWEQALAKKLLKPAERHRLEFHVDFSALTRGDSKTEMEYLTGMIKGRVMAPNEARHRIGLAPKPEGDTLQSEPNSSQKATTQEVKDHA